MGVSDFDHSPYYHLSSSHKFLLVPYFYPSNIVVGISTSQEDYLKFLFELNDEFVTVPSFGVIPSQTALRGLFGGGVPGLDVDPTKVHIWIIIPYIYFGFSRGDNSG